MASRGLKMGSNVYWAVAFAGIALAGPEIAMAAIPAECSQADFATAASPNEARFSGTGSIGDIEKVFSRLQSAPGDGILTGVVARSEVYYPFETKVDFGFRLRLIVGLNGRVRCIALAPIGGKDVQPQWNPQRRAWADEISRWRFRPLLIDGKPKEAVTELTVEEYELPERRIPMPKGDVRQVQITHDMPYFGYRIEVHGDGRAIYSSTGPYYFLGPQAYKVDPESVAVLLQQAADADFWSLRDIYPRNADGKGELISRMEITLGGITKSLTEYEQEGGTGLLRDAHFLPFSVRHVIDLGPWQRPTSATIDQLKENGFDFKGEAASRFLLQVMGDRSVKDEVVLAVMAMGTPQNAFGISRHGEEARTLMEAALSAGRTEIAGQLINGGVLLTDGKIDRVKVNRTFQAAIESGDLPPVDLILPFGPDVMFDDPTANNAPVSVVFKMPIRYRDEPAPLDVAKRLFDLGVDINTKASNGQTLLHRHRDNLAMAEFLIARGADLNALDNEGKTPLVSGFNEEVTLVLLERGANPRIGNNLDGIREMFASGQWPRVKLWLRSHGYEDVVRLAEGR